MVGRRGRAGWLHVAGAAALGGYVLLARQAEMPEARPWLAGAIGLGWLAVAMAAWREIEPARARWIVVGWALAFRLVGVGTAPSWEDDYHRYLWDGYQTVTTGNPYAAAPADSFGDDRLPEAVAAALDGVNHPDLPTIYGPVPQIVFALAAWIGAGNLPVLKLLLVLIEVAGWWSLRRILPWRGWVLVWWCPLAVTEIAFAGHVEAIGVAALAAALAAWGAGGRHGSAAWTALATATKPFGALLGPFVVTRFGGRATAVGLVVWAACYAPWWLQGSAAEWPALRAMAGTFEYNSTGYAVLAALLPPGVARSMALAITLAVAGWCWWRWAGGDRAAWPPLAVILAVTLACAPVVNPWYALWLLPLLAVQPTGWGIGILLAVPLAYTHGWGGAGGAGADYTHPWWTRPLEVVVVVLAAAVGRWRARTG